MPLDELDAAVAEVAAAVAGNSPGSIAAYKDLYRQALDGGQHDGLAYEAATAYPKGGTCNTASTSMVLAPERPMPMRSTQAGGTTCPSDPVMELVVLVLLTLEGNWALLLLEKLR